MTFRIQIEGLDKSFDTEEGEPVLDTGLRAGLDLPYDCQCGN